MLPDSQPSNDQPPTAADKSVTNQVPATDTLPQSVRMSDETFDAGLSDAVRNVLTNSQQNKGIRPEATVHTRTKRVKFQTKRLIQHM